MLESTEDPRGYSREKRARAGYNRPPSTVAGQGLFLLSVMIEKDGTVQHTPTPPHDGASVPRSSHILSLPTPKPTPAHTPLHTPLTSSWGT